MYKNILFLFTVNFALVKSQILIVQSYNERCELYDETSSCDDTVGLLCIDAGLKGYRCRCPNDAQFGTIYDSKRNKCVGKVLNSCVRLNSHLPPSIKFDLNDTLCAENSECNNHLYHLPICMCKKGYFETDEGTCAPVAKYGEKCDSDKAQCDSKNGIICDPNSHKCACKEESHQFYDQILERCVTFINGTCTFDNECVPMARCDRGGHHGRKRRNIIFGSGEPNKNLEMSFSTPNFNNRLPPNRLSAASEDGKCTCLNGYSQTKDGFCMPSYGAPCHAKKSGGGSESIGSNGTEICNPDQFLECLGDTSSKVGFLRCQCRNLLNERWNGHQCVSLPGRRCRLSPAYPRCEEGSECLRGVCQCTNGTSLNPSSNQCQLDYNQKCDAKNSSPTNCNIFAGLICHGKTGTCQCLDSYLKYDAKRKACVGELGSSCGFVNFNQENDTPFPTHKRELGAFIQCENNAVCSPTFGGQISNGKHVGFTCVAKS